MSANVESCHGHSIGETKAKFIHRCIENILLFAGEILLDCFCDGFYGSWLRHFLDVFVFRQCP